MPDGSYCGDSSVMASWCVVRRAWCVGKAGVLPCRVFPRTTYHAPRTVVMKKPALAGRTHRAIVSLAACGARRLGPAYRRYRAIGRSGDEVVEYGVYPGYRLDDVAGEADLGGVQHAAGQLHQAHAQHRDADRAARQHHVLAQRIEHL